MEFSWNGLALFVGFALVILLLLIGIVLVWKIFTGAINIDNLLLDDQNKSSLSRFQFLVFTFVIAGLYLLLCLESGSFVSVPQDTLLLLGLSSGSYVLSKGIDKNAKNAAPPKTPPPPKSKPAA